MTNRYIKKLLYHKIIKENIKIDESIMTILKKHENFSFDIYSQREIK